MIAAVIALLGTFITGLAAVLVAGITDRRAANEQERLRLEHENEQSRLAQEHRDESERLRIETALTAAKMLSTEDGKPADQATTAGALWALGEIADRHHGLGEAEAAFVPSDGDRSLDRS